MNTVKPLDPITTHGVGAAMGSSEQGSDSVRSEFGEIPLVLNAGWAVVGPAGAK